MFFVELFVPKGTVTKDRQRRIAERITTEVLTDDAGGDAPAGVIDAARAVTQLMVHEPDIWVVGGREVGPTGPPRYVVRVTVPGPWRKELSEHVISGITRVLAEAEEDAGRLYEEPVAWVYVVGVAEGSLGAFGQAMRSTDVTRLITKPYRDSFDGAVPAEPPAPGTAIDPVCGMTVELTDELVNTGNILEHEGVTYAFCASACRAVFAEELGAMAVE